MIPNSSQWHLQGQNAQVASTDKEWLLQTGKGDRGAFEQIYRTYHRRVFGFLYRMLDDAGTAEELVSDVMVEIWKSAPKFRGDSTVSTWVFGIARFKALTSLRRTQRESTSLDDAIDIEDSQDSQDDLLRRDSMKRAIQSALAKLTPEHREVMELTFFQDFSYPEIAKIVDCPVATVKTRMFYARKHLRELLGAEVAS